MASAQRMIEAMTHNGRKYDVPAEVMNEDGVIDIETEEED